VVPVNEMGLISALAYSVISTVQT